MIKYGWLRALLAMPAWILAQVVVSTVVFVLAHGNPATEDTVGRPLGIVTQFLQLIGTLAVVVLFRKLIDRRSFVSLGFALDKKHLRDLAAGIIWGIALISAVFIVVLLADGVRITDLSHPLSALANMTLMMIAVAFNEEVLVRGYLLNNVMASVNKFVALFLTSLVFALGHLLNPNATIAGLVNIILAGLVLGIYYIHRQNLWFPIGLHFAWNLFQGSIYGSAISGVNTPSIIQTEIVGSDLLTGGTFGFEASLVTTMVLSLAVLALHRIYRRRRPEVR
ncbi:MAG: CPBP family intramembrane glutamic endopeptidase [Candidatus Zixiibacteriota bacterium]